ncbi:hypothetical protein VTO42DRAFT_8399 [Malbranchea cinnamomea]
MQLPTTLTEALNHVLLEVNLMKPLIPTYAHLLVSALFPIYIGAHASLARPSSAAKPNKKPADADVNADDDEDEEDEPNVLQKMESLEPSDAVLFPIMAGLTLAGLYFLIKMLEDPTILNTVLNWYFSHVGFFFATAFIRDTFALLRSFVFPTKYSSDGRLWKIDQEKRIAKPVSNRGTTLMQARKTPLPGSLGSFTLPDRIVSGLWRLRKVVYQRAIMRVRIGPKVDFKYRFTILDVASVLAAAAIISIFAFLPRTWWITNFLGFCFCYGALQFMSPTTFWTGTLILSSLFFYDIYFVFFTPMMVTVAQKLDVPIKLLFPRPPAPGQDPDLVSLAMLGLGDIVIPGMMVGISLRFDHYLYYLRNKLPSASSAEKPQYVKATGGWGERFWTKTSSLSDVPEKEIEYYAAKSFPKTYFRSSVIGYVAGMVTTLLAMQISSRPQPALLYLVPGVLSSIWITAYLRGDVRTMWNFTDETLDDDDNSKTRDEKAKAKDSSKSSQGFFRRALFGERKRNSKESHKREEPEQDKPKVKQEKKLTKSTSSYDLFSLTVSIPRKAEPSENRKQDSDTEASMHQHTPPSLSSGSSSPVLVEREEPPPAKRRMNNKQEQ